MNNEWYKTFEEASNWATAPQLRHLFATMLIFCEIKDERYFFQKNWTKMIDDIQKQLELRYYPIAYCPTETELQDLLLEKLEEILSRNGHNIKKI